MKKRLFLINMAAFSTVPLLSQLGKTEITAPPKTGMVTLGKDLNGYYAVPEGPGKFSAVVVLMEAFGLNDNIKGVCNYLASMGYGAIAPDFYRGEVFDYSDIQKAITKLKTLTDDLAMADVGATLSFLGDRREINAQSLGIIGFCMGGRLSFLSNAVHGDRLKAAVSFYGTAIANPNDAIGRPPLLDRVEKMQAPILLIYGAKDKSINAEETQSISRKLHESNKDYTLSVFANAGHGFAAYGRDSYIPQTAAQAWTQTMNFFAQHLNK